MAHRFAIPCLLCLAMSLSAIPALAQGRSTMTAIEGIEPFVLPQVDEIAIAEADERRAVSGRVPHFAVPHEVEITPWGDFGQWELPRADLARWRLRLRSSGALSLSLAFGRYQMPPGGRMTLMSADGRYRVGPFTDLDMDEHGQLWTPPILTEDLLVEIQLPLDELDDLEIELSRVHHGYAGFGEPEPKAGDCHRHVACAEAEPWSDQVRSVALISIAGVRFCTGFLVNNTARDGRPFFLTADHCGVTPANAASVVVLWNHQQATCEEADAAPPIRYWNAFQSGARYRAVHRPSDTVLLELDDPPDPLFDVYYAGWDRSLDVPTWSTVIHHPNTDVKRISFDEDPARTTAHLGDAPLPGGNHLRIAAWEQGSTEGGSSGAPLFNQDKRVVGQLHGGYAACGESEPDWFGRFSAAWTGYGRRGLRLSDWLDPLGTGAETLDGMTASGLESDFVGGAVE